MKLFYFLLSKFWSILLLSTFYFLLSSNFVEAVVLVPCGRPGEPDCNLCYLLQMGKNIIYFLLEYVAIPIAVLFIVYGAFMIMFAAGNEDRVKSGRKIIQTAVWGVLIALAAWLIINTIISVLASLTTDVPPGPVLPWGQLPC